MQAQIDDLAPYMFCSISTEPTGSTIDLLAPFIIDDGMATGERAVEAQGALISLHIGGSDQAEIAERCFTDSLIG